MKALETRNPLTRDEVLAFLNENVDKNIRQWGENYIYTERAKEARDKKMKEFDEGGVVAVKTVSYCDSYGNGTGDFSDTLYSDGSVKTACYGYSD